MVTLAVHAGVELPSSELWVIVHRDHRRTARVAAVRAEVERALAAFEPELEGRAARPTARGAR